jgi:hypothetical protein
MLKTFYLLKLALGGNLVMNEIKRDNQAKAVEFYQRLYPELNLNDSGYAQHGHVSYCIAGKMSE